LHEGIGMMNLLDSALTPADISTLARAGISSALAVSALLRRVESLEGGQLIGRNGSGDYAGIAFPYQWPGEDHVREFRIRRDHPELERQPDGSLKEKGKYLAPPGAWKPTLLRARY
jgi:hypothetical protein